MRFEFTAEPTTDGLSLPVLPKIPDGSIIWIDPTAFVGAAVTGIEDCGENVHVLGFGDWLAEAQFVGIGIDDVLGLRAALDRIADDGGRW